MHMHTYYNIAVRKLWLLLSNLWCNNLMRINITPIPSYLSVLWPAIYEIQASQIKWLAKTVQKTGKKTDPQNLYHDWPWLVNWKPVNAYHDTNLYFEHSFLQYFHKMTCNAIYLVLYNYWSLKEAMLVCVK